MMYEKKIQFNYKIKSLFFSILVLGCFIFVAENSQAVNWKPDPKQCPEIYGGNQKGEDGTVMCGLVGSSASFFNSSTLYNLKSLLPNTSFNTGGGTYGGYVVNCDAYDGVPPGGPYCDNNGAFWCSPSSTCRDTLRVKTICQANTWASEPNASVCSTSPAYDNSKCIDGWIDCAGSTSACNVQIGVTPCGENNAGRYDASCGCIYPTTTFITGIQSHFSTSSPLLWGKQHGSGDLIRFTNNAVATSSFVVFNSGQVAIGHNINVSTTSVAFEVSSTQRGILIPRLGSSMELDSINNIDGHLYYNTTSHKFRYYNGTAWSDLGGGLPSGSVGQILVNNGGETWVTSSIVYVNTTTGRVGIGTTDPTSTLEVVGTIYSTGSKVVGTSTASDAFVLGGYSTFFGDYINGSIKSTGTFSVVGMQYDAPGNTFFSARPGFHDFYTGDGTGSPSNFVMRIMGGKVGIGTTTLSSLLSVAGTSTLQNIIPAGPYTGYMSAYNLGSSTTRWNALWVDNLNIGTSTWSIKQNGTRLGFYNNINGTGTENMTIFNNGNVGIGTTSSVSKLTLGDDGGIYSAWPNYDALAGLSGQTVPNFSTTGTLMFWYPRKGAFRAGALAQAQPGGDAWNDNNIGVISFAAGANNVASATGTFVAGVSNSSTAQYSAIVGGVSNSISGQYGNSFIGGGYMNSIYSRQQSFIGGGYKNSIYGASLSSAFIGGGQDNTITASLAFIGGGQNNSITASNAFIGGGINNNASGYASFVAGGQYNTSSGQYSFTSGYNNTASGHYSNALGRNMTVSGEGSFGIGLDESSYDLSNANTMAIMGGNVGIGTTSPQSLLDVVGTAATIKISDFSSSRIPSLVFMRGTSTVFGADIYTDWKIENNSGALRFSANASGNSTTSLYLGPTGNIGVGTTNPSAQLHIAGDGSILATGTYGSGWSTVPLSSGTRLIWIPSKAAFRAGRVTGNAWDGTNIGDYSVAFGVDNLVSGDDSAAIGGYDNQVISERGVIAGGNGNIMDVSTNGGFIGGSYFSKVQASGGFVAGGYQNRATYQYAFVAGSYNTSSANATFVAGGSHNIASGGNSFIGAGDGNTVSGISSFIGGGTGNVVSGNESVAFGSKMTVSGDNSFGINLHNINSYTLSQSSTMSIMGGNVGIGTVTPATTLHVNGSVTLSNLDTDSGSTLYAICVSGSTGRLYRKTGGSCLNSSDVRLKTNIVNITSERDVLEDLEKIRGIYFNWVSSTEMGDGRREIGLIAQEVEEVLPEIVYTDNNTTYKSLDYVKLTAFLVEVAKAQQIEIEALREAVSTTLNVQQSGGQLAYSGGDLDLQNYALLNVKNIIGTDNKWAIDENGQFITRIQTSGGNTKEMFAMQSPYSEFVFSSSSELVNGEAIINFDPDTCELIDETQPLKVNITLTGECSGIFVKEKSATGFIVKELGGGNSSSTFDWMVIAKRKFATTSPQSLPTGQAGSPSQGEEGVPSPLEGEGEDEVEIPSTLEGEGEAEPLTETGDGGEVVTTTPPAEAEPLTEPSSGDGEPTTTPEIPPEPPAEAEPLTEQSSGDGEPTPPAEETP